MTTSTSTTTTTTTTITSTSPPSPVMTMTTMPMKRAQTMILSFGPLVFDVFFYILFFLLFILFLGLESDDNNKRGQPHDEDKRGPNDEWHFIVCAQGLRHISSPRYVIFFSTLLTIFTRILHYWWWHYSWQKFCTLQKLDIPLFRLTTLMTTGLQ